MHNEKKKVVPKLRQEVKVKVDIVTSDDIKIYYTRKFQDFTARYIIKDNITLGRVENLRKTKFRQMSAFKKVRRPTWTKS